MRTIVLIRTVKAAPLVVGVAIGLLALAGMLGLLGGRPGPGVNRVVTLAAGAFVTVAYLLRRGYVRSNLLEKASLVFFSYLFVELILSALYFTYVLEPPVSTWAFENAGNTLQFDPVRGCGLTGVPSRTARVTRGTVEYVGTFKGNNRGFADRDDFHPGRDGARERRYAVLGDSFSAAQHIARNWPDAVEDLARDRDLPVRLLNFSVDGGGLANWWSILTRFVETDRYEIDGVIFAVYPGDLERRFSICDDRDAKHHMFGRISSWDPAAYPTTREAARPHLKPVGHIVSTATFERVLAGSWAPPRPPLERTRIRFYFAWKLWTALAGEREGAAPREAFVEFDRGRHRLIADMKRSITAMGVPAIVIHVPSRVELLSGTSDRRRLAEARAFSELLGARFIDGRRAFAENTGDEIRAMWLPYDGHWGQGGSDRFAGFMTDVLATTLSRPRPERALAQ
jgi:hypothetical protein